MKTIKSSNGMSNDSNYSFFQLKEIDNEKKMAMLDMPDFLNRTNHQILPSENFDDVHSFVLMKSDNGDVAGSMFIHQNKWVLYRDSMNLKECHQNGGGVLEFPKTADYDLNVWLMCFNEGEKYLKEKGREWAFVYCPSNCQQAIETVMKREFKYLGACSNTSKNLYLGLQGNAAVFGKKLQGNNKKNIDLFPYATQANVRSNADATNAPSPNKEFWAKATMLYSGYSGLPLLADLLDSILGKETNIKTVLSVPCSAGDTLLSLPPNHNYENVVGMDITHELIEFGTARVNDPLLDVLNRFLIHLFFDNSLTFTITNEEIRGFIYDLCKINNVILSKDTLHSAFYQLREAFFACIKSPAISDYWILTKGIAGLVFHDKLKSKPKTHPLKLVPLFSELPEFAPFLHKSITAFDAGKAIERVHTLSKFSNNLYKQGKINFKCKNVMDIEEDEREFFDCIFGFECTLMFHASGVQNQFLNALIPRVKDKGIILLTGLRNNDGSIPVELQKAQQYLSSNGFRAYSFCGRVRARCTVHANMKEQITPILYAKKM